MDDESLEIQIAQMEKRNAPLRIKHENLSRILESRRSQEARYFDLIDENTRLEREIAEMEGRATNDDKDSEY